MSNIISKLEAEQMQKQIPDFAPGDTVVVQVWIKEGNRERLQAFEGVVIARRNRGLNSSFTVRKISQGEGVERVFQSYSPTVDSIKIKRRGHVRKAKLYYLRERSGRSARIKEKILSKEKLAQMAEQAKAAEELAKAEEAKERAAAEEEAKQEAKGKAEAETETKQETEAKTKTETKQVTEAKTEPETKVETKAEQAKTEKPRAETKQEAEAKAKTSDKGEE